MKINIAGGYITKFGELWDLSLRDLLAQAVDGALAEGNIEPSSIDAVFVANKASGQFENQLHLGALVSQLFSHFPPSVHIEAACASGGVAVNMAILTLLSGKFETVMVVGAEKMTDVATGETTSILSSASDAELERGSTFPGLYALLANAYGEKYADLRSAMSAVAVKNHFHALNNPQAQFHKKITSAQVEQSPLVAEPLRLLDCSPISDGASAVVLTTKKIKSPQIIASCIAQDTLDLASRASLTSLDATVRAGRGAFNEASLSPTDIKLAEVHDCFTIAEILAIEDLGFFRPGAGGEATLAGQTTKGGKVIVNSSGGLKACGHPVGATGVKQIAFLYQELKLHKAKTALAHNVGGSGATASVHILSN